MCFSEDSILFELSHTATPDVVRALVVECVGHEAEILAFDRQPPLCMQGQVFGWKSCAKEGNHVVYPSILRLGMLHGEVDVENVGIGKIVVYGFG